MCCRQNKQTFEQILEQNEKNVEEEKIEKYIEEQKARGAYLTIL